MSILDHLLSLPVGVHSCMLNVIIAILEILAVWWLTSVVCELDDDKKYISLNLILKIQVPGICEPQEDRLVNIISSVRKDVACEQDAMVLLAAFGLCPNPVGLLLRRKHETSSNPCHLLSYFVSFFLNWFCFRGTGLLAIPGTPQSLSCRGPLLMPFSTFLSDLHDLLL